MITLTLTKEQLTKLIALLGEAYEGADHQIEMGCTDEERATWEGIKADVQEMEELLNMMVK